MQTKPLFDLNDIKYLIKIQSIFFPLLYGTKCNWCPLLFYPSSAKTFSPRATKYISVSKSSCSSRYLFFVLLKLLLQFFSFAFGIFEIFPHFNVLQIQLSKFLFIFLYELGDFSDFPKGKKERIMYSIPYKNTVSRSWLNNL